MSVLDTLLVSNNLITWTLLVIFLALLYQWFKPTHPDFPPGFKGFPFLGVVPYLGKNPERVFKEWSVKIKKPVISVRLGSKDAVVLNTLESVQQVLANESINAAGRPDMYSYTQVSKENGIPFANFSETYKRQRIFAQTHLKKGFGAGPAAMEKAVNEEVSCFIQHLRRLHPEPLLNESFLHVTFNVVLKVIASGRYDLDGGGADEIIDLMSQLFGESEDAMKLVTINLFSAAKYIPPFKSACKRAKLNMEKLLEDFVDPMIKEHKVNFDPHNLKDYIDVFLYQQEFGEDKHDFNDEQLRNCVLQLVSAGADPLSAAISWTVLCWVHYPEYHPLVQKEIDAVLGKDKNPTMSMRDHMPMTCAFLHEVMRFRCPVNIMFREAIKPASVMGYSIPSGTTILVNLWGVHNDPEVWGDPDKFRPKRHLSESGQFVPSNHVIPFCLGYRRCLGEHLAMVEQFITFTKLLQNFDIKFCSGKLPEINESHNNLVHCPVPFKVNLVPR